MLFYINNQVSPVVMPKNSVARKLKALSLFLAFMCSFFHSSLGKNRQLCLINWFSFTSVTVLFKQ